VAAAKRSSASGGATARGGESLALRRGDRSRDLDRDRDREDAQGSVS
jgi:hypothetical protein